MLSSYLCYQGTYGTYVIYGTYGSYGTFIKQSYSY